MKMIFSIRVYLVVVNSIPWSVQVWGDSRREGSTWWLEVSKMPRNMQLQPVHVMFLPPSPPPTQKKGGSERQLSRASGFDNCEPWSTLLQEEKGSQAHWHSCSCCQGNWIFLSFRVAGCQGPWSLPTVDCEKQDSIFCWGVMQWHPVICELYISC